MDKAKRKSLKIIADELEDNNYGEISILIRRILHLDDASLSVDGIIDLLVEWIAEDI